MSSWRTCNEFPLLILMKQRPEFVAPVHVHCLLVVDFDVVVDVVVVGMMMDDQM